MNSIEREIWCAAFGASKGDALNAVVEAGSAVIKFRKAREDAVGRAEAVIQLIGKERYDLLKFMADASNMMDI